MGSVETEQARAVFERGDWSAAYNAWSGVEAGALSPADLQDLATVAELLGHHDEAVGALQRAFVRRQAEGDPAQAVRCAYRLALTTAAHGETALSAGWTSRAESLLPELGEDVPERGWVAFLVMFRALGRGELAEALTAAEEGTATGRRHHDADLVALGTCSLGRFSLYSGRVTEGLALLDDAMVRVIAGETSPVIAGQVYCTAIEGCQEISELGRVAEWTSALERWCAAQPGLLAFTGQCAVHRGQLMRLHGEWSAALDEFELATERYREVGSPDAAGLALCEAGDVLRLRGDLDQADDAYRRAAEHGHDPQPGLALLWLARGQRDAAFAAIDRLVVEPGGPIQRLRFLPGAVDVLLACGNVDRAREVTGELAAHASALGCAYLEAMAARAAGAVELAAGDAAGALPYLRKAQQLWSRVGAAFEGARTRALMGRALAAVGDASSSRRELEAARSTFRRLGARPAAEEVSLLLAPRTLPAGLTAREVEVLRLVASGRSNAQIASTLVLSEKTVARHLSNIFGKLDVGSRTAATAYAFEHGLV